MRPGANGGQSRTSSGASRSGAVAQVFVAPICSTLALDGVAYEHFLQSSGVLDAALDLLPQLSFADAEAVEMARKQIQALVMAAEVQFIVDGMSA